MGLALAVPPYLLVKAWNSSPVPSWGVRNSSRRGGAGWCSGPDGGERAHATNSPEVSHRPRFASHSCSLSFLGGQGALFTSHRDRVLEKEHRNAPYRPLNPLTLKWPLSALTLHWKEVITQPLAKPRGRKSQAPGQSGWTDQESLAGSLNDLRERGEGPRISSG